MSTLKVDKVQAATDDTDLTLQGSGTGSVIFAAGTSLINANVTGNASVTRSLAVGYTDGRVPQANLEVKGNTHITGLTTFASTIKILGGSPGADKVLTSDADGDASWETAGGGGAWTVIQTVTASNDSSLTVTGISDTYDYYCIGFSDILMANNDDRIYLRMGDSSGIDSGATDYSYWADFARTGSSTGFGTGEASQGAAFIEVGGESFGAAADEGWGGIYWITCPSGSATFPQIMGMYNGFNQSVAQGQFGFTLGKRNTVIAIDRIQIYSSDGNIVSGRVTLWGIAHA